MHALLQTAVQLEPTRSVLLQQLLHLNMLKLTPLGGWAISQTTNSSSAFPKQRTMLPFSHHTTRNHSHLNREGVCIFDEDGLYSEALAERCSLVNSSQGYSLICVEAPGKVGPGRGERSGGEGRGGKERQGEEREDEGRGGKH